MYKLTLKDKFEILQPFWEQFGSEESPNDRSCIGIGNSTLGVCRPTTDVLSISIEGTGVSDGSGKLILLLRLFRQT